MELSVWVTVLVAIASAFWYLAFTHTALWVKRLVVPLMVINAVILLFTAIHSTLYQ